MTAPISSGLIAQPYHWQNHPDWNPLILDTMVAHPQFFQGPSTPEDRRLSAAAILVHASHKHWGVWQDGQLLGILSLTQITPGVTATLHFLFFDRNLVGKRSLLRRFLDHCFTTEGLRRLTAEVPEDADKLLRFYRKLGFRFEGEGRATGLTPTAYLEAGVPGLAPITNAASWIAKIGSRVEGVFWREDRWLDVLRLRLNRDEWGREEPVDAIAGHRRSRGTSRGSRRREDIRARETPDHRPTPA